MSVVLYEVLYKVKLIDEKIRDLSVRKNSNPKDLTGISKKLKEAEQKLKTKSSEAEAASRKNKHICDVLGEETAKLKRAEEKLAAVKNSKEYQAALKEVNQLKKAVTSLSEQQQASQAEADKFVSGLLEVENEFKVAVKDYEAVIIQTKDMLNIIESELIDIKDAKDRVVNELPEELKKRYLKAYESKNGAGVSVIRADRCSACNMSLPRQFCNQVLKADHVYHCPSCQRLIIYINKE